MPTDAERVERARGWFEANAAGFSQPARCLELALFSRAAGLGFPAAEVPAEGLPAALVNAVMGEAVFPAAPAYQGEFSAGADPGAQWAHSKLADGPLPALALPEADGYALTHAVLYASDFAPMTSAAAAARCEAALAAEEDWDLIGEYLICLRLLGAPADSAAYEAWWDQPFGAFEASYHPAMVGALLFALRQ